MERYINEEVLRKEINKLRISGLGNKHPEWHNAMWQCLDAILQTPTADVREVMNSAWIPVTTRPMDSEEREYWSDHFGYPLDDEDAVIFNCKMPEDGQEILVSYSTFVSMDTCEIDGGCYGLEENGDWEGITAWMPLPKSFKP